jgi:hypothetical protein
MFITVFTRARLWTLSWVMWIWVSFRFSRRRVWRCLLGYCAVQSGRNWPTFWLLDDGSGKHLWNVGQFLPAYTAQYPRRQSSSIWIWFTHSHPLFGDVWKFFSHLRLVLPSSLSSSLFPTKFCTDFGIRLLPWYIRQYGGEAPHYASLLIIHN